MLLNREENVHEGAVAASPPSALPPAASSSVSLRQHQSQSTHSFALVLGDGDASSVASIAASDAAVSARHCLRQWETTQGWRGAEAAPNER